MCGQASPGSGRVERLANETDKSPKESDHQNHTETARKRASPPNSPQTERSALRRLRGSRVLIVNCAFSPDRDLNGAIDKGCTEIAKVARGPRPAIFAIYGKRQDCTQLVDWSRAAVRECFRVLEPCDFVDRTRKQGCAKKRQPFSRGVADRRPRLPLCPSDQVSVKPLTSRVLLHLQIRELAGTPPKSCHAVPLSVISSQGRCLGTPVRR